MVLLENVQMNVYKLTTEQNNLTVSEFHSFRRQNHDSLHPFWSAPQDVTWTESKSKNVPEDPAHF